MISLVTVAAACMFCAGFCAGYGTSQFVELLRTFRSVRPLSRPQQRPLVHACDPFTRELARRYRAGRSLPGAER